MLMADKGRRQRSRLPHWGRAYTRRHRNPGKAARPVLARRYSRRVIGADPLTGRDSELGIIRRALGAAGNRSGVVIAGAAGVGKTWLAHEVLRRAEASGERTN